MLAVGWVGERAGGQGGLCYFGQLTARVAKDLKKRHCNTPPASARLACFSTRPHFKQQRQWSRHLSTHPTAPSPSAGLWFLWHHFFFLDIWLGHMHLKLLCGLIGAAMLPALLLPGLVHGRHGVHHARQLVGGLMVVQVGVGAAGRLGAAGSLFLVSLLLGGRLRRVKLTGWARRSSLSRGGHASVL